MARGESGAPGETPAAAGDVNADGSGDVLVGAPRYHSADGDFFGRVQVVSGKDGAVLFEYSVDVDGDGNDEVVTGDPAGRSASGQYTGLVVVYSPAMLNALVTVGGPAPQSEFGHSVAGIGDISGEGVPDIVAGAPGFNAGSGRVVTMLGDTGWPVHFRDGLAAYQLGLSVAAWATSTTTACRTTSWARRERPTSGRLGSASRIYLMDSPTPAAYCTALPNSQGCDPAIDFSGAPSAGSGDNFVVTARDELNNKFGILFWGYEEADVPFGGGTLCVAPPLVRTPVQHSGGSAGGSDCSGTYAFHFSHAYLEEMVVSPGETLCFQFWSRDPFLMPYGIGLTDALGFQVAP